MGYDISIRRDTIRYGNIIRRDSTIRCDTIRYGIFIRRDSILYDSAIRRDTMRYDTKKVDLIRYYNVPNIAIKKLGESSYSQVHFMRKIIGRW